MSDIQCLKPAVSYILCHILVVYSSSSSLDAVNVSALHFASIGAGVYDTTSSFMYLLVAGRAVGWIGGLSLSMTSL